MSAYSLTEMRARLERDASGRDWPPLPFMSMTVRLIIFAGRDDLL